MTEAPQVTSAGTNVETKQIDGDILCVSCAYNLRGLGEKGKCPECGIPIERSLWGDLLKYADASWLRRLRIGLLLMQICSVTVYASMAFSVVTRMFWDTMNASPSIGFLNTLAMCANIAAVFVGLCASWMFATRDPRQAKRKMSLDNPGLTRFLIASAPSSLAMVVFILFGPVVLPDSVRRACIPILYATCVVSCFALWITITTGLATLADRIPDYPLALRTRRLRDHIGLIGGVAAAASIVQLFWTAYGNPNKSSGLYLVLNATLSISLITSFVWLFLRYILLVSATRRAIDVATLFGGVPSQVMAASGADLGSLKD